MNMLDIISVIIIGIDNTAFILCRCETVITVVVFVLLFCSECHCQCVVIIATVVISFCSCGDSESGNGGCGKNG